MPDPELGAARAIPCAKRGTAVNGMTGKALVFEVKRLSNLADHLLRLDDLFVFFGEPGRTASSTFAARQRYAKKHDISHISRQDSEE